MAKKSLLKKIFGRSKHPKVDANQNFSNDACAERPILKVSPNEGADVEVEPVPTEQQAATVRANDLTRSDSATLDTESDHSASPRLDSRKQDRTEGGEPLALFASSVKDELPPLLPTIPDTNEDAVVHAAHESLASGADAEVDDKADDESVENDLGKENEEGVEKTTLARVEKDDSKLDNTVAEEKKDKKAWAEERVAQMMRPKSCSKPLEKQPVEVSNELNAERRKWIEGLSSPKREPSAPHIPDDARDLGKLSDRMKAVECALQEKGKGSCKNNETHPVRSPNREKAAAQRKAVEDMLKKQTDPMAFLEAKSKATTYATPSPGRASAQKKRVEDMLQKQLDPNAFYESKGKSHTEALPGKDRLASQKKWVLETLEKQNDPNNYLDKNREARNIVHEQVVEKKGFEELKNRLEGKVKEAEEEAASKSDLSRAP